MAQRKNQLSRSLVSPYPLLDKIEDPDLFKGRDESIAAIGQVLQRNDVRVILLHAPSGTGKTSFLYAGLKPVLGKKRRVVIESALHTHGLARRLLAPLGHDKEIPDKDPALFVAALDQFNQTHAPPLFVLDAFESAFRGDDRDEVLARVGLLLGMTAKRGRVPCQWIMAIRDDAFSSVRQWLGDVLANVDRLGWKRPDCRSNLKEAPDFAHFPLPAFGSPPMHAGVPTQDPFTWARKAFLAAIRAPLDLRNENNEPRYALQFEDGAAEAIADAFAEERKAHPNAPLVPVLQIVLDHLFTSTPVVREMRTIRVDSKKLPQLIRDALADHLHRKLTTAFPFRPWNFAETNRAKTKRTRAFLLLLRLAQENQATGLSDDDIDALQWSDGHEIVKSLQDNRLLRREWNDSVGKHVSYLPHQALVEHLLALGNDWNARSRYELDKRLVELSRIVATLVKFHERGEREGTTLPERLYDEIAAAMDSLPTSKSQDAWWNECKIKMDDDKRRRLKRRRLAVRIGAVVGIAGLILAFMSYAVVVPEQYRAKIFEAKSYTDAAAAFRAWSRLPGFEVSAREAFAKYLVRMSLEAGVQGHLDEAILLRLKALEIHDRPDERLAIADLVSTWPKDAFVLEKRITNFVRTSPRGDSMLVPVRDGFALHSTQDGRLIGNVTRMGPDESIVFNPDGHWFYVLSPTRAQVWNVKDGKPHGQPLVAPIEHVEVNADGSYALTCGKEGISLWNLREEKEHVVVRQAKPNERQACLQRMGDEERTPWAWSPKGDTFAILEGTRIEVWDATSGQKRSPLDVEPFAPSALQFDTSGQLLLAYAMDQARILELSQPVENAITIRHEESILRVSVTKDPPRWVFTGSSKITAWNSRTGQAEKEWPRLCGSKLTAVLADDKYVTEVCGSEVLQHDDDTTDVMRSMPCPTESCSRATVDAGVPVVIGTDGFGADRFVVVRGYDQTKRRTVFARAESGWGGPEITEDNQYVLVVSPLESAEKDPNNINGDARFLHIDSGELSQMEFPVRREKSSKPVITSEAGDWVVVEDPSGVKLVDRRTGFLGCDELLRGPNRHAMLSSDGLTLAVWTNRVLSQFDVATCAPVGKALTLSGKWSSPDAVVFSKDDQFLGIMKKKEFEVWPVRDAMTMSAPLVGWQEVWERRAWKKILGWNVKQHHESSRILTAFVGGNGKYRPRSMKPPCDDSISGVWHLTSDEQWIVLARQQSLHLFHYGLCAERGKPILLDSVPVAIEGDAASGTLAVLTNRWVHFLRVGPAGLEIRASRLLTHFALAMTNVTTDPRDPTFLVLTGKGESLLTREIVSVEPSKSIDWIAGPPQSLSKQWIRRLGRQVGADGKIEIVGKSPQSTTAQP